MTRGQVIRLKNLSYLADDMSAAIDSFVSFGSSKNLSENTLSYYRFRLNAFKAFAPNATPASVTPQLIRDFLAHETKHNSPSTANHSRITLRAFFNFLTGDGPRIDRWIMIRCTLSAIFNQLPERGV
ncbi:MAG: site-specific integrase [Armatimonadetes bacterium]|nr:site-specific integrase [Armatimonadota bacterium]